MLVPGGAFVYVEFHPLVWSFDANAMPTRDDYFQREPFFEPVGDYVRESGTALGCKVTPALVPGPARTWVWPAGVARLPLMFGLRLLRGK